MAFTPICPKCGSAAVMEPGKLKGRPVGSGSALECIACNFTGKIGVFRQLEDRIDHDDLEPDRIRRAGHYLPSRTIPLSDENS